MRRWASKLVHFSLVLRSLLSEVAGIAMGAALWLASIVMMVVAMYDLFQNVLFVRRAFYAVFGVV